MVASIAASAGAVPITPRPKAPTASKLAAVVSTALVCTTVPRLARAANAVAAVNTAAPVVVPPRAVTAVAALDESFFRVRFDRLTPAEKRYLRAMAEIGPGPHRSGDIAEHLDRAVTSLGPTRSSLIGKGMVWSPNHGDTAFTVPLFDEFLKRAMPDADEDGTNRK